MTALLVDDERTVREGLKSLVDWNRLGVERVLDSENGCEALSVIESEQVDILVTDIRMPSMNGVELLAKARCRERSILSIVVSGYDDFQYVREAFKLGAADYLLKPINEKELEAVITEHLSLRSAGVSRQASAESFAVNAEENLYNRLLSGSITRTDFLEKLSFLSLPLPPFPLTMILAASAEERPLNEDERERVKALLTEALVSRTDRGDPVLFFDREALLVLLIPECEEHDLLQFLRGAAVSSDFRLLFAGGGSVRGLGDIARVYETARMMLRRGGVSSDTIDSAYGREKRVEQALDYIREHYREDLSVQQIAEACHANPAYLGRIFKEARGEKMIHCIHRLRVGEAARLLRETDLMVYEVADRVGYRDLNLFRTMFKRFTGASPSMMRKFPDNRAART